ncbi:MAG: hypothetical protein AAF368_17070, partial [Planctomycetota bacterium]
EQVRGQGEDGRTDIYSLGTIIYQMGSGRLPFQGKTSMEILIARLEQTPTDLTSEEAPKWLRETIRRFLKRDRDKRPTAREAQSIIAQARGEEKAKTPVGKLILLACILLAIPAVLFFFGTGSLDVFGQRTESANHTPGSKKGAGASSLAPNAPSPTKEREEEATPQAPEGSTDEALLGRVDRAGQKETVEEFSAAKDQEGYSPTASGQDEEAAEGSAAGRPEGRTDETESLPADEASGDSAPPALDGSSLESDLDETESSIAAGPGLEESSGTIFSPTAQVRVAQLNAQRELHTQEGEPVISCEVEDLNQVGSMLAPQGDELSAGPDERVEEGRAKLQLPLGSSGSFDIALFDGKTWNGNTKGYDSAPLSTFSVVIDRDKPEGQILE